MLQLQEPGRSHVITDAMLEEIFKGFNNEHNATVKHGDTEDQIAQSHNETGLPNENGAVNSLSNRSSASSISIDVSSSAGSSGLSAASATGSEEEKQISKYAQLDIAKILHTRKRIHKILQVPLDGVKEQKEQYETNSKKKLSVTPKHQTHYGTVGYSKCKSTQSALKRYSSSSRTPSTDGEYFEHSLQLGNYSTWDIFRTRKDEIGNPKENEKLISCDPRADQLHFEDSSSESEVEMRRNSSELENKRWSRLSTASLSSDKRNQTPQKGPWKAFRKFVNHNSSVTKSQTQKNAIHVYHNSSNNNSTTTEEAMKRRQIGATSFRTANSATGDRYSLSSNVSHQLSSSHRTTSLLRRFSKKSSFRGRSASRRNSLPSQSAWNVRSRNCRDTCSSNPTHQDSPLPRFQYGDGSQMKVDIETMVMSSLRGRIEEESQKFEETPQKSTSFRKRILSFTRRRSSSRERKTVLRSKAQPPSNAKGQMNKALSYSSPQLSIFSVNSASNRSGIVQKLEF